MNFKNNIRYKYIYLFLGIICTAFITFQTVWFMNQPMSSTGFFLLLQENGFLVEKVVDNSAAARAGIKEGMILTDISETNASEWYKLRKRVPVSEFMKKSSVLFEFGRTYDCVDAQGDVHTFFLEKQSPKFCFLGLPLYVYVKYVIAMLHIFCGLFCLFFYGRNHLVLPFVLYSIFAALAIYNSYTTIFEIIPSTKTALVCFDIGGFGAGIALLEYFYHSFLKMKNYSTFAKIFKSSRIFLCFVFLLKYLVVLLGLGNMMDVPFVFVAQIVMGFVGLTMIFCSILMIIKFSRKMTLMLRFILLGFLFALSPTCFYLLKSALTFDFYVTSLDKLVTLIPLGLVPIALTLSVVQSARIEINRLTRSLMTWLAYFVVVGIIMILFSIDTKNLITLICILISPAVFYALQIPINRFLSLGTKEIQKKQEAFVERLSFLDDLNEIFTETSSTIINEVECTYVFIQIFSFKENDSVVYKSKSIPKKMMHKLILETQAERKRKNIIPLSNGGFAVQIFSRDELFGCVFIGRKRNKDDYLGSEQFVVSQLSEILLQTLIYHESLKAKKEREQLKSIFSRYLSPELVNEIVMNPEVVHLGGEKKYLTVLFSDIQGFTTLSEIKAPDVLVRILNTYLTEMSAIILAQGGTIDKYEGDAIMAFFGAPVECPDHAERACRAAMQMLRMEQILNEQLIASGLIDRPIVTRIGVNTGEMIVGNVGSVNRLVYTVIGNEVNIASRIEDANKDFNTNLLVSQNTWDIVKNKFVGRFVAKKILRGMKNEIGLYLITEEKNEDELYIQSI